MISASGWIKAKNSVNIRDEGRRGLALVDIVIKERPYAEMRGSEPSLENGLRL
jgi:hypothetical protein